MTAAAAEVLREPPLAQEPDVKPISDREFALFRDLIGKEVGIDLPPFKKALVMGRLSRRLRELQIRSFGDYYERVVGDKSGGELFEVINRICTNETSFFREPQQFEFLEKRIYPSWLSGAGRAGKEKKIRVWSAACSTGEEPFSLAMSLLGNFPPDSGWRIEILATDLSTRVLSKARQATWPVEGARRIPENYLKPFMLRGVRSQMGSMKAAPELRSL
ncbi:MAG: CheR family methyltransferase, partial [Bdellovibrionota bacterium]